MTPTTPLGLSELHQEISAVGDLALAIKAERDRLRREVAELREALTVAERALDGREHLGDALVKVRAVLSKTGGT